MKNGNGISIESASLTANIPVKSYSDFRFSFFVSAAGMDQDARARAAKLLKDALPVFNYSTWGNDTGTIAVYVADTESPGICNHLTQLFCKADQPVYAMGAYQMRDSREAPHLGESPPLQNVPEALKDFETFKTVIEEIVDVAIKTTPRP